MLSFNFLSLTNFFLTQALANTGRYNFSQVCFLSPEGRRGGRLRSGLLSAGSGDAEAAAAAAAAVTAAAAAQTRPGSGSANRR